MKRKRMQKERSLFFFHYLLLPLFSLVSSIILLFAIYRKKTYGPDWKHSIVYAASTCIASVPSTRRSARLEIYPAGLFNGWFMNTLELMSLVVVVFAGLNAPLVRQPQGIVAAWSEPVK